MKHLHSSFSTDSVTWNVSCSCFFRQIGIHGEKFTVKNRTFFHKVIFNLIEHSTQVQLINVRKILCFQINVFARIRIIPGYYNFYFCRFSPNFLLVLIPFTSHISHWSLRSVTKHKQSDDLTDPPVQTMADDTIITKTVSCKHPSVTSWFNFDLQYLL